MDRNLKCSFSRPKRFKTYWWLYLTCSLPFWLQMLYIEHPVFMKKWLTQQVKKSQYGGMAVKVLNVFVWHIAKKTRVTITEKQPAAVAWRDTQDNLLGDLKWRWRDTTEQGQDMSGRWKVMEATKHSSKLITCKTLIQDFIGESAAQVTSCGICGGQSGTEAGPLKYLYIHSGRTSQETLLQ
jgi:hypothetical protein